MNPVTVYILSCLISTLIYLLFIKSDLDKIIEEDRQYVMYKNLMKKLVFIMFTSFGFIIIPVMIFGFLFELIKLTFLGDKGE